MELSQLERRVLGVLIEKSLATPDYYPLTVNALVAGCNQRSNRDPVMNVSEGEAQNTLASLRRHSLATVVVREGSRADRWAHNADTAFALDRRQIAVLAELLLRGPQTEGELRSHASRMEKLDTLADVTETLRALQEREPPLAARMPREPGKRGIRYRHLLAPHGEAEPPALAVGEGDVVTGESGEAAAPPGFAERIEALESSQAALKEEVTALRRELDTLKEDLG